MKKRSHNLSEPSAERGYKRRYLVRKIEEQEAEDEIEHFTNQEIDDIDNDDKHGRDTYL